MRRILFLSLIALAWPSARAQSSLPPCPSSGVKNSCFGSQSYSNQSKYIGEWDKDKFNGKGAFTFSDGRVHIGEWLNNRPNGQFIEFKKDRSIERSGIYEGGVLITSMPIDPNSFLAIVDSNQIKKTNQNQESIDAECSATQTYWHLCRGSRVAANGTQYSGEFRNNQPDGQGTLIYPNGDKYIGALREGKRNGQGTFYYLANNNFKGDVFIGEYKDDKRNGWGVAMFSDGRQQVGEYLDIKLNGYGIEYHANKKIKLSGRFENNKLVESLTLDPVRFAYYVAPTKLEQPQISTQSVGSKVGYIGLPFCKSGGIKHKCIGEDRFFPFDKYFGELADSQPNGIGIGFFNSGNMYVGEFQSSEFHGQGAYTFATGEKYIGQFVKGKYEGLGTYVYAKDGGKKYVGMWMNSKNHGPGILYSSAGEVITAGDWFEGKFIRNSFIDQSKFPFDANEKINDHKSRQAKIIQLKKLYELINSPDNRQLGLKDKINKYVHTEIKQWLVTQPMDIAEIPPPVYPAAISLKQEPWESNKEFEDRVETARNERRKAIDKIQTSYKEQVELRNKRVEEFNKQRSSREIGLSQRRRELVLEALEQFSLRAAISEVNFDQQTGAINLTAQVDGIGKQFFPFQTPLSNLESC